MAIKKATYLEFVRRTKELTQQDLAKRVNVHPSAIAQIEGRHRRSWSRIRRALTDVLGVKEEKLFDKEGFAKTLRRR